MTNLYIFASNDIKENSSNPMQNIAVGTKLSFLITMLLCLESYFDCS